MEWRAVRRHLLDSTQPCDHDNSGYLCWAHSITLSTVRHGPGRRITGPYPLLLSYLLSTDSGRKGVVVFSYVPIAEPARHQGKISTLTKFRGLSWGNHQKRLLGQGLNQYKIFISWQEITLGVWSVTQAFSGWVFKYKNCYLGWLISVNRNSLTEVKLQKPTEVSTFRDFSRTIDFDIFGLCFHLAGDAIYVLSFMARMILPSWNQLC